nr:ubiquitin hydrolase [Tanacetum cinerariifolium]
MDNLADAMTKLEIALKRLATSINYLISITAKTTTLNYTAMRTESKDDTINNTHRSTAIDHEATTCKNDTKVITQTSKIENVTTKTPPPLRPSPSIESNSNDLQNSNSSVSKHEESSSTILSKPMIKFIKVADSPGVIKTNKTTRKPPVKYVEMYMNTSKSPNVRGNQRNWNNLKSQQLGKYFMMKNKACFKCGHFDHLAYDCGVWVEKGKNWPKNNFAHKNVTPRADLFKTSSVSATRRVNTTSPRLNVNSE